MADSEMMVTATSMSGITEEAPHRDQLGEINQQLAPSTTLASRQSSQSPHKRSSTGGPGPSPAKILKPDGSKGQDPAAVSESTESFYYRDRLLPPGWYVKIVKKKVAEYNYKVETIFYSPGGAVLTSQEQVAAYMSGQLSVDTIGHRPPVPVSQMPWRDQLSEINQQLAPTLNSRIARSATIEDP